MNFEVAGDGESMGIKVAGMGCVWGRQRIVVPTSLCNTDKNLHILYIRQHPVNCLFHISGHLSQVVQPFPVAEDVFIC